MFHPQTRSFPPQNMINSLYFLDQLFILFKQLNEVSIQLRLLSGTGIHVQMYNRFLKWEGGWGQAISSEILTGNKTTTRQNNFKIKPNKPISSIFKIVIRSNISTSKLICYFSNIYFSFSLKASDQFFHYSIL